MNILLFVSYVFSGVFPCSPYFYNKELDELCFEKVTSFFIKLYNPTNCLIIDEKVNEETGKVVLVEFYGYVKNNYSFYSIGDFSINRRRFKNEFQIETCDDNINEVVTAITEKYKTKNLSIYFTVNIVLNSTDFFNEENLINSIDKIKESYKRQLAPESVVKYFPMDYHKAIGSLDDTFCCSRNKMLDFKYSDKRFLFFFDNDSLHELFEDIKSNVTNYDDNLMNELKSIFKEEEKHQGDYYILSLLSKMGENLHNKLNKSQVKILLKIWDFLTNKINFKDLFIELINKNVLEKGKNELNYLIIQLIIENHHNIRQDELQFLSHAEIFYFIMNFINFNKNTINDTAEKFISHIFLILVSHFNNLSNIVLSSSQNNVFDYKEISNIIDLMSRSEIENLILDYVKYINNRIIEAESNPTFESMSQKIIDHISSMNTNDISVLKEFNDPLFKKYSQIMEVDR